MGVDPKGFDPHNENSVVRYAYGNNNPYYFRDPNGAAGIPFIAAGESSAQASGRAEFNQQVSDNSLQAKAYSAGDYSGLVLNWSIHDNTETAFRTYGYMTVFVSPETAALSAENVSLRGFVGAINKGNKIRELVGEIWKATDMLHGGGEGELQRALEQEAKQAAQQSEEIAKMFREVQKEIYDGLKTPIRERRAPMETAPPPPAAQ